jgi:alanyl-tRNA synthetase
MNSNEIRRRFLKYFEDRGHTVVKSSSLIPAEDPTLLFVNAGMNQFKEVFQGRETRPYTRAATCQKVVRAGGKHNDLDNVGHTRRHQTFFEMLGNFSFGDYFKDEAIGFAWELLTSDFKLQAERLWVTVFREDDEAERLWTTKTGIPRSRIVRLDEENFWQMGDTGPCGPCSEIHYDFGPAASEAGHADCAFPCECGRYVEFWNLVFMQFDRNEQGQLIPLPKPSIDTGMGLERVSCILQGKLSNYETDLLRPIIDRAAALLQVRYGQSKEADISLKIIADHVKASTFLISDGVLPSNEGRGYVLRKIMRRGIRQGTLLGFKDPFLYVLSSFVTDHMKEAYPELVSTRDYVTRIIKAEEERFAAMASVGLERLEGLIAQILKSGGNTIPGGEIFKLYDTFGFPLDFTKEIADEKSINLDMAGFEAELEKQRERARQSWKGDEGRINPAFQAFADKGGTQFLGYQAVRSMARVIGIIRNGTSSETLDQVGAEAEVLLDQTPFYAESGGQVGDVGTLTSGTGVARVLDTYSPVRGLVVHKVRLEHGKLATGDEIDAQVDEERRRRIAANHTGTHILHAALRDVLGPHVKQAGSLVAPDRLRFDYSHFAPLTAAEIQEIERRINSVVFRNLPVQTQEMEINDAIAGGAIAFFGERYAQQVRVVSIPEVSKELCGGTHTKFTGDVGLFKVISESGVAAGVRRIEALTGFGTYTRLEEDEELINSFSQILRSPRQELARSLARVLEQQRELERELESLQRKAARSQIDDIVASQKAVKGVPVVARKVDVVDPAVLRELAEQTTAKIASGVVVLALASGGKVTLVGAVSPDLRDKLHAGNIIKKVAGLVGGSGGGRPDFAQAGGKNVEAVDQALQAVYNIVAELLN